MNSTTNRIMAMICCVAALACTVEDEADAEASRAVLVEEAKELTALAFEDHAACMAQPEPACAEEQADLLDALESLHALRGDEPVFRASATVNCHGTSFTCTGNICWAEDGEGCVCAGPGIWSVQACEQ